MINIQDEVLEFTKRRFSIDCNWLNGNCFFYCQILKSVFHSGVIFYDTIQGHFVFLYNGKYYDWSGIIEPNGYLVEWNKFKEYDEAQYKVIVRDCIK